MPLNSRSANFRQHIEDVIPDGRINKMADLQKTKFLRLFGLTNAHYLVFIRQNVTVSLCRVASALRLCLHFAKLNSVIRPSSNCPLKLN